MSRLIGKWPLTTLVLFCAGSAAWATQTTTFTLTGVEQYQAQMGGVYTSPYVATIGGVTGINVICDDFADDSYVPETWTTYVTSLPTVSSSSPVKWTGSGYGSAVGYSLSQSDAYAAAAYLAIELLNTNQSTQAGRTIAGELSFAMWGLFDAAAYNSISGSVLTASKADLTAAIQNHGLLSSYTNVSLYSYDAAAGLPVGCGGTCGTPPQEFIVVNMPEPPSLAILAVDMLGVLGLVVFFRCRRRTSR
jgi:hypothetical protein